MHFLTECYRCFSAVRQQELRNTGIQWRTACNWGIAEGVKTRQQANFLLAHGRHWAERLNYSRAVPAQAFSALLYTSLASSM
jgi:hypothetical protein